MDRAGLQAFNAQCEGHRVSLYGVKAIFRDVEIEVLNSSTNPSLNLVVGGFREERIWRFRVPAGVQPPPAVKEPIIKLGTNTRYVITTCVPADPNSASELYHTVEAEFP